MVAKPRLLMIALAITSVASQLFAESVVTGTVLDFRQKPLVGARISIQWLVLDESHIGSSLVVNGGRSVGPVRPAVKVNTETNGRGEYQIELPKELANKEKLAVTVSVRQPGFAPVSASETWDRLVDHPAPKPNQVNRRFLFQGMDPRLVMMKQGQVIGGQVVTADGTPIADARIQCASRYRAYSWKFPDSSDYPSVSTSKTNSRGRFVIQADHDATMVIQHDDFAPIVLDNASSRPADGKFVLTKGRSVSGRVLDATGKPMARLLVTAARNTIFSETNPQVHFGRSTFTDENGNYELPHLPGFHLNLSVGARIPEGVERKTVREWGTFHRKTKSLQTAMGPVHLQFHRGLFDSHALPEQTNENPRTHDFKSHPTVKVGLRIDYPDAPFRPGVNSWRALLRTVVEGVPQQQFQWSDDKRMAEWHVRPGAKDGRIEAGLGLYRRSDSPPRIAYGLSIGDLNSDVPDIAVTLRKLARLWFAVEAPKGETVSKVTVTAFHAQLQESSDTETDRANLNVRAKDGVQYVEALPERDVFVSLKVESNKRVGMFSRTVRLDPGEQRTERFVLQPED